MNLPLLSNSVVDDSPFLYANFNQDFSCLSVAGRQGYRIFNTEPFGKCYANFDGGIGIAQMLFSTSLLALVGAGEQPQFSPRRLQIVNTKRNAVICELNFVTSVLAVRLNRRRLVVVLESSIHIYDISNMKLLHTIDTCLNLRGLCDLSSGVVSTSLPSLSTGAGISASVVASAESGSCFIAYPANVSTGQLLIFDSVSLQSVSIIQAHKAPLAALSFNHDGSLLATASETGTVIRIFSIPDSKRLYQLRRGSMTARVTYLSFNAQSNVLCVCSDSDTVHIYKLASASGEYYAQVIGKVNTYLPGFVNEMWEPVRDFARIRLSARAGSVSSYTTSNTSGTLQSGDGAVSGQKSVYAIAALSSTSPHVLVVTSDGYFREYSIDLENGGDCELMRQFSLVETAMVESVTSAGPAVDNPSTTT